MEHLIRILNYFALLILSIHKEHIVLFFINQQYLKNYQKHTFKCLLTKIQAEQVHWNVYNKNKLNSILFITLTLTCLLFG